jgi:hypothetical protein
MRNQQIRSRAVSEGIEVRRAGAQDAAAWDAFVRRHPQASFFHLSGWNRAVNRVFGHAMRDLVALRGDEIVGVLPLMSCATPFLRRHLISTPYAVYGGPVACDQAAQSALLSAAAQLARQEGVGRVELRCERALEQAPIELEASQLYATFVHPLPETADEVMKNLPKRARAEVRKAIDKHGLTLREGLWYLPDLERLFLSSKQGLGSPGLPRSWFEELAREFSCDTLVHCVHKDREVIAATMSFVFRDTLLFFYVGTDARANREYSATNFMVTRLQPSGQRAVPLQAASGLRAAAAAVSLSLGALEGPAELQSQQSQDAKAARCVGPAAPVGGAQPLRPPDALSALSVATDDPIDRFGQCLRDSCRPAEQRFFPAALAGAHQNARDAQACASLQIAPRITDHEAMRRIELVPRDQLAQEPVLGFTALAFVFPLAQAFSRMVGTVRDGIELRTFPREQLLEMGVDRIQLLDSDQAARHGTLVGHERHKKARRAQTLNGLGGTGNQTQILGPAHPVDLLTQGAVAVEEDGCLALLH